MTIADTGPTVQVIRKPPSAISANCPDADMASPNSGAPKANVSPTSDAIHSSASVANLVWDRRWPTRSTTAPQTTLPTAPQSTTNAARTPASPGATPWTRLRKLGSQDHTDETTIS